MGVKLFLLELYPSPLTGDKQSTSKQGQKKEKKGKTTHSQLISHLIILLTHILKQNYCRFCYFTYIPTILLGKKFEHKSSQGILQANSVAESSHTVNAQMSGEHSAEPTGRENVVASSITRSRTELRLYLGQ